jgi:2-aminoadipate transaminase
MTEQYDPMASVQAAGPPGVISFIYGLPDPESFPADDLRAAADQVLRERPEIALQYGPEQGYGPLIDYLIDKIARDEGMALERRNVVLTGGSTQALDHACTLFAKPGDRVLVEAPTYYETLQLFRDHDLNPIQAATDVHGLQVGDLSAILAAQAGKGEPVRFLYTIPSFQNPSGVTLTTERRVAILDLAERYDVVILEDDVYRDLVYDGDVPPSLFELDGGRRVLRIGSFSKILAPALRLGWMIGAPRLVERVVNSGLRCMSGGASPLVANILASYCQKGLLETHIERLREVYRERRDVTLRSLESLMPPSVRWTHPRGGFFVWLSLPEPLCAADVVARAKDAGLWLLAGDSFFAERATGQHLRLAFSYVAPQQISEGIETLGRVIGTFA